MKILERFWQTIKSNPKKSIVLSLITGWLFGVQIYNAIYLEQGYARISGLLESVDDLENSTTSRELYEARYFAAMSAQAYRLPDLADSKLDKASCDLEKYLAEAGWRLLPTLSKIPTKPKGDKRDKAKFDGDLVFGIWQRETPENMSQLALVFRGTHTYGDWWSNARWITKHLNLGWDQYDLTRTVAHYIDEDLATDHPELFPSPISEIVVAGHSLAGGLAHQAGYAVQSVKRVYSFNGSSVTGFYSVPERDKHKIGMRIYRIGERGEFLSLLRNFMRLIYPVVERDPKIVEATYNFGSFGLISQHSIDDLACKLFEAKSN